MINKEIPFPKMPLKFLKSGTRDLGSGFPSLNLRGFFVVVGFFGFFFLFVFAFFLAYFSLFFCPNIAPIFRLHNCKIV